MRVFYFQNLTKTKSQFKNSFLDFFDFSLHDNTALYVVALGRRKNQKKFEQVSGQLLWHFDDDAKCFYFGKNQSRKLLKKKSDFFFCRVQPYYVLYYEAEKSRKKSKTKF